MGQLGLDCRLYYNTGTYASPTWVEITNVRDVELNLTRGKADLSTRGSNGYKEYRGQLKDASITFDLVYKRGDATTQAIFEAFDEDTLLDIAVLDGDIETTGTEGLRAVCEVFDFSREEPLEEGVMISVELAPSAKSTDKPSWMVVA